MEVFDSHCHLAMKEFEVDVEEVIRRAKESGVQNMVTIGASPKDWAKTEEIALKHQLFSAFALSPHDAKMLNGGTKMELLDRLKNAGAAAVGETGLDYHYFLSGREEQIKCFEEHITIAESMNLPLIIHSRDSFEEAISMLKTVKAPVIIHCFTYGKKEADTFLNFGFYISFSGIVTFKNAVEIQEAAKMVPLDRILVETDAPYLAPIPYRGKRCEPSYVAKTAEFLAGIRGIAPEEFFRTATNNAQSVFRKK